jgi:hypothetical protein
MKRIIKIRNVGNVVFPDHMSNAEIGQAARLHAHPSILRWTGALH